jgi:pimeloyl-ACP methyl ester carboxylesterase
MRRNPFVKILCATLFLSAALAVPAVPAAASTSCTTVRVPATLAPGQPVTITGSLCRPRSFAGGVRQVDVLVHGGTYNGTYWDWPLEPNRYSYVRKTTDAGRATFTYDRPGAGNSTRPPSALLNVAADANVLHQLIQWLRGRGFGPVTVIGHSLGSIVSVTEAATYHDANRLVLTSFAHFAGPGAVQTASSFYPAILDPRFAGTVTDPGYLTTRPGTRSAAFYYAPAADPDVIAFDEATKDIMSSVEYEDSGIRTLVPAGLNESNRITAPVLMVIGQRDANFCGPLLDCSTGGAVRAAEAPFFTAAPSLTAETIPDTGHSLTLHPSADVSFARINDWIKSH